MCKKIKFDTEIRLFITLFLSSLEMPQKMLVFTKLTCAHKMWRCTSGKTGFHSEHLSRTKFDPRLKGPSVPVHLKMWAREHWSRFKRDLQSRFRLTAGTNAPWSFSPGSWNKPGLKVTFSPGLFHEPGPITRSNEPSTSRQLSIDN
jgi:hypothetical protein